MRSVLVVLVWLAFSAISRIAWCAEPHCNQSAVDWAQRCSARAGLEIVAAQCRSETLILRTQPVTGEAFEVEIAKAPRKSFRRVGDYALSIRGRFARWEEIPAANRRAFEQIAECVHQLSNVPLPTEEGSALEQRGASAPPIPWLAAVGLALFGVLAASTRPPLHLVGALGALGVLAYGFRVLTLPFAFFHQNGHGPLWVDHALQGHVGLVEYGPGYREVFGFFAGLWPQHAEVGVFIVQSALGAALPPLAWIIARCTGARVWVCWAIALVVAVDPILGRLARSESYLAICTSLLTIAGAALAIGSARARLGAWQLWLGAVTAGLFVAQAARIHPLCWVPAAALSAVPLVGPGRSKRRLAVALASAITIAVVVALVALPAMLDVWNGSVGGAWGAKLGIRWIPRSEWVLAALLITVAAWRLGGRRPSVFLSAGALAAVVYLAQLSNVIRQDHSWFQDAVLRQSLPALVATAAALLARLRVTRRRARTVAITLGSIGVLHSALTWSDATILTTDVQEASFARRWRDSVAPGTVVGYLSSAGKRALVLPIYEGTGGIQPRPLDTDSMAQVALPAGSYYYRSSLCEVDEGAGACQAFERRHRLVPVSSATFPAVESQPWLPFVADQVRVTLYRVDAR